MSLAFKPTHTALVRVAYLLLGGDRMLLAKPVLFTLMKGTDLRLSLGRMLVGHLVMVLSDRNNADITHRVSPNIARSRHTILSSKLTTFLPLARRKPDIPPLIKGKLPRNPTPLSVRLLLVILTSCAHHLPHGLDLFSFVELLGGS